jgi:hypothetical protein
MSHPFVCLNITTEGKSELNFVKDILADHLSCYKIWATARSVLTSRDKRTSRQYRGGLVSYEKAKKDIHNWLKQEKDSNSRFTTMFDFYALPTDFPDYDKAKSLLDPYQQVEMQEEAMARDIGDDRFIPYIQLHEFEALILASPQALEWEYLAHEQAIRNLIAMVGEQNPELINGGENTAPSKRILQEIPEYNKALCAVSVSKKIGLERMRQKCPHFQAWLCRLERLGQR